VGWQVPENCTVAEGCLAYDLYASRMGEELIVIDELERAMRLKSLSNLATSKATRTDSDSFRGPTHHCTDSLDVGIERTLRLVIRVANVIAALVLL